MNYFDSIYSDNLPSRAVAVYMYLFHRANRDGQCWPSEKRIAKDLSMSLSTVKEHFTICEIAVTFRLNSVIAVKAGIVRCYIPSKILPNTQGVTGFV